MKFIQLGNGGGLDPTATNSSFLVQVKEDEYLLFDCGFNIMQRLIELQEESLQNNEHFHISKIKYVFISHIHDDHVGNTETLMYWNYFKNNVSMTWLYANEEVKNYLEMKMEPKLYNGGKVDEYPIIQSSIRYVSGDSDFPYIIVRPRRENQNNKETIKLLSLQETFHGGCPSNGLVIIKEFDDGVTRYKNCIVISGDTKASLYLEEEILYKTLNSSRNIIYHDFSNWNCPSKNVHACKSDTDNEYSDEFKESLIWYHNNGEFNRRWQDW